MPQQGLKVHALPQGDALRRRADGAEADEVDGLGGGVQQPSPRTNAPVRTLAKTSPVPRNSRSTRSVWTGRQVFFLAS